MKPTLALLAVSGLLLILQGTLFSQTQQNAGVIALSPEAVGQTCEIVLKRKERPASAPAETCMGEMIRFDDKSVVLVNATRTARVYRSVPVLSSIPYVKRWFRNTGTGVETITGELEVRRADIESITYPSPEGAN